MSTGVAAYADPDKIAAAATDAAGKVAAFGPVPKVRACPRLLALPLLSTGRACCGMLRDRTRTTKL